MAQGFQHGTKCLSSIQEYGSFACSAAAGSVSAGYLHCTNYTIDNLSVNLYLTEKNSWITRNYTVRLTPQTCQYPAFNDTYLPILAAAIPLLVLIWIGKKLYSIFGTEKNV